MADVQGGQEFQLLPMRGTVLSTQVSVGTTATVLPASALSNRRSMVIRHQGTNSIFLGGSGVTTGNGIELKTDEMIAIDLDDGASIYGIVASGTETAGVLEVS